MQNKHYLIAPNFFTQFGREDAAPCDFKFYRSYAPNTANLGRDIGEENVHRKVPAKVSDYIADSSGDSGA